jgi:importin subunit beta-1
MKDPDERVALQAVEFWSTVCEEEVDVAFQALCLVMMDSFPGLSHRWYHYH